MIGILDGRTVAVFFIDVLFIAIESDGFQGALGREGGAF
jgi:hypothetical protein